MRLPIDETVTSNPITYTSIDSSNGFWEFESPQLKAGSKTVKLSNGNTAIAETGTTVSSPLSPATKTFLGQIKLMEY